MKSLNSTVRTGLLTASLAISLAASVAAAPQRDRSNHMRSAGHSSVGVARGPDESRGPIAAPHGHIAGSRGRIFVGAGVGGGLFYDPFWGPYYPYGYGYPYPWAFGYPSWQYEHSADAGSVRTEVTPKNTEVFVDGYYAGTADNFDGAWQRLHTAVGGHTITLHLDGYRTVTQNVYVRSGDTVKVKEAMEKLAPGEVTEPVQPPAMQ